MKPPTSISSRAMARGRPDQGPSSRANTDRIRRKRAIYWAGFLEGAISSGRMTQVEEAALEAEARGFMAFFNCPDAGDLLQDINAQCFSSEGDMIAGLTDIINNIHLPAPDPRVNHQEHDEVNRFMGLCAGVICDGLVTLEEARALLAAYERADYLGQSPVFDDVGALLFDALYDDRLTPDEAEDLQTALAILVGDAFSDTGVAAIGLVSQASDLITEAADICIEGHTFVITGALVIGPRAHILRQIAEMDGQPGKNVTRKTDYLVISDTASRAWHGTHFGRKIEKALRFNEEGARIQFVTEHALAEALAG